MLLVLQPSTFHYNPTSSSKLLYNNTSSFHCHVNLKTLRTDESKKNLIVGCAGGEGQGVAVEEKKTSSTTTTTTIPPGIEVSQGYPTPLGATCRDGGVNFSISSTNASAATLCLFNSPSELCKVCVCMLIT